jgi:NifU-like protein
MWEYTDKVMDYFRNPKNVGTIADPDGVGEVGSIACGDALRLMFKLDGNGRITDAKFQTFGCASAIASSSALTEMIKGKTLEEAEKVTNQDIAAFLGGLPEQKMHCSVMGRDALLAAIEDFRKRRRGEPAGGPKADSRVVCICMGVTEKEIERAIRENHLTSVEEVTNYTKAGGGCGGCHPDIEAILARVNGEPAKQRPVEPPKKKRLTTIQKLQLIQETLEREIRPALRQDGGDIELLDLDGNQVVVSLRGTCSQCRVATVTLKDVVQAKLREFVSEDLTVVEGSKAEECA